MAASKIERKTFTFIWKIKNFSFCWHANHQTIHSPHFKARGRDDIQFELILLPDIKERYISCVCKQLWDIAPFSIGYELAFLTRNNESAANYIECSDYAALSDFPFLFVQRDTVFGEERDTFLPNDTLTIQCKIWEAKGSFLETGQCVAETEIEVNRIFSIWNIERFSCINDGDIITESIDSSATKTNFVFNLYLQNGICCIEINPLVDKSIKLCKCQIFCLDAAGRRLKCGRYTFMSDKGMSDTLSLMRCYLMANKRRYLPNDVLTLQYEIEFSTGIEFKKILEPDSHPNLMDASHDVATDNVPLPDESYAYDVPADNFPDPVKSFATSLLSWKDDLLEIYENGHICDAILKSSSNSFSVHSLILCIRSPVFNDLLKMEDSKNSKKCLCIKGLNTNTLRKMIVYLYTDNLDNLDGESAKNLYIVSNDYEIPSLTRACSYFLKKNLESKSCCEILNMAAKYQDHDLISYVDHFISKNAKYILQSDAWKNLEESNPSLACKTLRKLYLEK